MKNGYRSLDKLLKKNGLRTSDALGTVCSKGSAIRNYLLGLGYNVDSDMKFSTYDYIVLGKSASSIKNILIAKNRLNSNGIIVIVLDGTWTLLRERYQ